MHYEALDVYEQHSPRILGVTQIPNLIYVIAIATTSQAALQVAIAHHVIMPNNPYLVPTSVNLSPQQLIVVITKISPTIDAAAFVDPVGEFFRVFELEFRSRVLKKFSNLLPSFGRRMKPSRCSIRGFSSSKRIFRSSQTWKLPIDIFVH